MCSPVRRVVEQWGTVISIDVQRPDRRARRRRVLRLVRARRRPVQHLAARHRDHAHRVGRARARRRRARGAGRARAVRADAPRDRRGAFDISFGAQRQGAAAARARAARPVGSGEGLGRRPRRRPLDGGGRRELLRQRRRRRADRAGVPPAPTVWRVGIQHPWERDRVAAVLECHDAAVATSGRYERGDHVLDPRTGLPATGLASVTVVGPDLAIADAYATAAVVLGAVDGMRWLATRVGYEAMGITDDRAVLLDARVRPLPGVVRCARVARTCSRRVVGRRRQAPGRPCAARGTPRLRLGLDRGGVRRRRADPARVPRRVDRAGSSSRPASCRSRPAPRPRPRWRSRRSSRWPGPGA